MDEEGSNLWLATLHHSELCWSSLFESRHQHPQVYGKDLFAKLYRLELDHDGAQIKWKKRSEEVILLTITDTILLINSSIFFEKTKTQCELLLVKIVIHCMPKGKVPDNKGLSIVVGIIRGALIGNHENKRSRGFNLLVTLREDSYLLILEIQFSSMLPIALTKDDFFFSNLVAFHYNVHTFSSISFYSS